MKGRILLAIGFMVCVGMCSLKGQQRNNFETEVHMPIMLDTANQANIWQIGIPSKSIFSSAHSEPNALLTDTSNFYPISNQSSFYFKLDMANFWAGFPFFMVSWHQKMDCEIGRDGGVIEVSYDSMQTWVNIFEDTVYQPVTIFSLESDTIFNGEIGISEIDTTWKPAGLCWSSTFGSPVDEVFIRFTFYSDTNDTFQEGWMIDNFYAHATLIDNVEQLADNGNSESIIGVYPNPTLNRFILRKKNWNIEHAIIQVIDMSGNVMVQQTSSNLSEDEIDISFLNAGTYFVVLRNENGAVLGSERILKATANQK